MTTATLTDAATVTLAFPLAAAEGLRHAITLALPQRPTSERDMLASIYGALVNPQPAPTVRAAGAPVDVLAVMDFRIDQAVSNWRYHGQDDGPEPDSIIVFRQARAAIAELIDSQRADARLVAVLLSYLNDNLSEREKARLGAELMTRDLSDHAERRAAALARVGGAA